MNRHEYGRIRHERATPGSPAPRRPGTRRAAALRGPEARRAARQHKAAHDTDLSRRPLYAIIALTHSFLRAVPKAAKHPPASSDYRFSEQIGHLLRRAYQRHVAIFQQAIPDSQLTAAQFVTLCAVRERGACSLNDIVKATAIDQATIRGVVERLKARGLIAVAPDPSDGRKVLVTNTAEGNDLVERTVPFAHRITEQTFGSLNPAERVAIVYLLGKMIGSEDS